MSPAETALAAALALIATPAMADPCEAPLPKRGEVFSGRVAYIGDGDSLCVASKGGLIEVRLADWYAPELHDAGGKQAKQQLEKIALGREATCRAQHRSYDRIVASCALSGKQISALLSQSGAVQGGRGYGKTTQDAQRGSTPRP